MHARYFEDPNWLSEMSGYDALLHRMQMMRRMPDMYFTVHEFVMFQINDTIDFGFADRIEEVY